MFPPTDDAKGVNSKGSSSSPNLEFSLASYYFICSHTFKNSFLVLGIDKFNLSKISTL